MDMALGDIRVDMVLQAGSEDMASLDILQDTGCRGSRVDMI